MLYSGYYGNTAYGGVNFDTPTITPRSGKKAVVLNVTLDPNRSYALAE